MCLSGSDSGASMTMRVCSTGTGPADVLAINRAGREERFLVAHRDFFFDHRADFHGRQRAFERVIVVVNQVAVAARAGVA